MKKKFEVFISSKQDEFKRKRKEISKLINDHPYLESTPLELRGASADNTTDASIKAVRKSDIYIGIFGEQYSEITVKEYREAVLKKIPCFIYVKKIKNREVKLSEFLKNDVESKFKFHEFSSNKKLLEQIETDLNNFIFDLLQDGLKQYSTRKEKATQVTKETNKQVERIVKKKEFESRLHDFFSSYFTEQDYLRLVIGTSSSIEELVRASLEKLGFTGSELTKPLGWMLYRLLAARIIDESDLEKINQIQYIRNDVVHRGRQISKSEAERVLRLANDVTKKLSQVQKQAKLGPAGIVLKTDRPSYKDGDIIKIIGGVQVRMPNIPITISIINTKGNVVYVQQVDVRENSTFETSIRAGGHLWQFSGQYVVKAIYGHEGNTAETSIDYVK